MSIFVTDPKLAALLTSIEGPCFTGEWTTDVHTRKPVLQAYNDWRAGQKWDDRDGDLTDKSFTREKSTGIVIYGAGGWNRYFVRGNGEVVFSRYHGTDENGKKAVAAGFSLWE